MYQLRAVYRLEQRNGMLNNKSRGRNGCTPQIFHDCLRNYTLDGYRQRQLCVRILMRIRRVTAVIHRISLCRQNRGKQSWKEGGRMRKISRIECGISKTTKLYAPIILVWPNVIAGKRNQGEYFSRINRKHSGLIYMTYFQLQNHFLKWCPILMGDLYTYTIYLSAIQNKWNVRRCTIDPLVSKDANYAKRTYHHNGESTYRQHSTAALAGENVTPAVYVSP